MKAAQRLTAIIERHDEGFVALCPEPDVASEGASIEEARANLIEALTLVSDIAAVLATGEVALVLSAMQLPRSATVFIAQGRSSCANDVAGFLTS